MFQAFIRFDISLLIPGLTAVSASIVLIHDLNASGI